MMSINFISKTLLTFLLVSLMACRETKNEEAKINTAMEELESINKQIDTISNEVNDATQELEETLQVLDSL